MIDVASTAPSAIQWGPYIILILGAGGIVIWYSIRRFISKLDSIGKTVDQLTIDMAVVKDRQKLTAQKVGVTPKQLEDSNGNQ